MYTNHRPAWDAKNRHGLPDELPFIFAEIAHIFAGQLAQAIQPINPQPAPQTTPVTSQSTPETAQTELPIDMSQVATDKPQVEQAPMQQEYNSNLPTSLTDLMKQENVTEDELKQVAYIRGHFPLGTPIENFPPDYWGMIVAHWNETLEVIKNQVRTDPELPFTMA